MNSAKTLRNILLATSLGGLAGIGCVITTGSISCEECDDSPLCHNHFGADIDGDGQADCFCDAGYTWEDPNDPGNFECERIPDKPGTSECVNEHNVQVGDSCICEDGYIWCQPDDPNDLTCCTDPAQDTVGGTGSATTGDTAGDTETGGSETSGGTDETGSADETGGTQLDPPDPSLCTEDGLVACSNDDPDNVQGSVAWICEAGEWVDFDMTDTCTFEGDDFAYGCWDSGELDATVNIECGQGPGTACTADEDACADADLLQICIWGKLTEVSCNFICAEDTEAKVTYDFGECVQGMAFCQCCDNPIDGTCDCDGESICE